MAKELKEHDEMQCRACYTLERASEGYPCQNCGTFICLMCSIRGVMLCANCAAIAGVGPSTAPAAPPAR
jgi:hypothetical protein